LKAKNSYFTLMDRRVPLAAAITIGLLMFPSACGRNHHSGENIDSASLNSIATDLPDNGGTTAIHLFWVFAGQIHRGDCAGPEPLIPRTCSRNVKTMNYDQFKSRLDNGLSQSIKDLSDEASEIQAALARIYDQIRPIKAEIERLERDGDAHRTELAQLRHEMEEFQIYVSELQDQLRYIEDELRRAANDPDLRAQQAIVMDQLGRYRSKVATISAKIPALLDKVRDISDQVAALQYQLDAFNTRLSNLQSDLDDVMTRLNAAYDDFSVYEDTLRRLESQVIYTTLSTNGMLQRQRQFIRRFEKIFEPR